MSLTGYEILNSGSSFTVPNSYIARVTATATLDQSDLREQIRLLKENLQQANKRIEQLETQITETDQKFEDLIKIINTFK